MPESPLHPFTLDGQFSTDGCPSATYFAEACQADAATAITSGPPAAES